jgi:tRNA threonylcarbamoyladenosine biosynthesis protein TsaB
MKLLAVDTCTDVCSVCVTDFGRSVAEYVSKSSRTHTERLLPAIQTLFSSLDFSLKDLDGLAVIHGPGSFTGLRISLSVVKGLAFALQRPVVAMNALEVAASQVREEGWICPVMDARRGEIFTGLFRREGGNLVSVLSPRSITPSQWKGELPDGKLSFCGPGASLYFDAIKREGESTFLFSDFVLAQSLAELALQKFLVGEVLSGSELRAAYLRPSDAEIKGPRSRRQPEVNRTLK